MAKTNTFQKNIKDYNIIRLALHKIFLYGCYSRNDYLQLLNISGRKYDDIMRRIRYCFGDKFILEHYQSKTKYITFAADMYQNSYNFLINSFFISSLAPNTAYAFFILQLLNKPEYQGKTFLRTELEEMLFNLFPADEEICSETTQWRIIKELIDIGVITTTKQKNAVCYQLAPDIFLDFTTEELINLFYAIKFYANTALLGVPGYYLLHTLKLYLKYNRQTQISKNDVFQFKHTNFSQIIDDPITYTLCKAITEKKAVEFTSFENSSKQPLIDFPIAIETDQRHHRQYVIFYKNSGTKYRIDQICTAKITKATPLSNTNSKKPKLKTVQIDFHFDHHTETYILARLQREVSADSLEELAPGHYLYTVQLNNPRGLLPWIRTYHRFAQIRPSTKHNLVERLTTDWKEALTNYGIIQ